MSNLFSITLGEIAKLLNAELQGDAAKVIRAIKPLESATEDDLTFFAPTSRKKAASLKKLSQETKAAAVIVSAFDDSIPTAQIKVEKPLQAVVGLAASLYKRPRPTEIHPTACVDPTATVGAGTVIGPYAVVGANVSVGDNVTIHPHVVIYAGASIGDKTEIHASAIIREYVQIGKDCLIQPGVVVGGDGFGYASDKAHGHQRIPHMGVVVLEDEVDLGANATVDRATFGETRVGKGTKIDNLVMLGHNVKIGQRGLLCSQVGISGSTTVGDNVILAGKVGVADHVTIANGVRAAALTGIDRDVEEPGIDISGMPWIEFSKWRRIQASLKKLPEIITAQRKIQKKLGL